MPRPSLSVTLALLGLAACAGPETRAVRPSGPRGFLSTLGDDLAAAPGALWEDTETTFSNPWNLLAIGAAGFSEGILINLGIESEVAEFWEKEDYLTDDASQTLAFMGTGYFLFGGAAALYAGSTLFDDPRGRNASQALFSSLAITGTVTLGLKQVFPDIRPNGHPGGYPSGHASLSMAAAATLAEYYGPAVDIPAYLLTAAIGVQRMDRRWHDLDDVAFGWVLGFVVGKSVAGNHAPEVLGMEVVPYADPWGNTGIGLVKRF